MRPEDIRAFAQRPWREAEQRKIAWWRRQKELHGPEEALAVVEELRKAAVENWPHAFSDEARKADLDDHARVARAFQQIARALAARGSSSNRASGGEDRREVVPGRRRNS